jgi:hypothetical protein
MKCEGRPNGPCPDNRNDNSVHNTIGDLFLCDSCEQYRYPLKKPAGGDEVASLSNRGPSCENDCDGAPGDNNNIAAVSADSRKPASKKPPAANQSVVPLKTATVKATRSNRDQAQQQSQRNDSTRSGRRRPTAKQASDLSDHSDDEDDPSCAQCLLPVGNSDDQRSVKCDVCGLSYHQRCTSMPVKVIDAFIKIKLHVGWVCEDCRELARLRGQSLMSSMNTLAEEVAMVKTELCEMKKQVSTSSVSQPIPATVDFIQASPEVQLAEEGPDQHICMVVHRTLRDAAKRKRNVVITGLSEESTTNDREAFIGLCERFLSTKPYVIGCERLGPSVNGRTRKLLVRLATEAAATDLLRAAHRLRRAPDPSLSNIYINADLSPAEAKMAFEARKRRRVRRLERAVQQRVDNQGDGELLAGPATGQSAYLLPAQAEQNLNGNSNDTYTEVATDATAAAAATMTTTTTFVSGRPVAADVQPVTHATTNAALAPFLSK